MQEDARVALEIVNYALYHESLEGLKMNGAPVVAPVVLNGNQQDQLLNPKQRY